MLANLIAQSIGTIDGKTLDPAGVRLVLYSYRVGAGSGVVTAPNPDGTGSFLAATRPYYQWSQKLAQNEISSTKAIRLQVPTTIQTFTAYFVVATKVQAKLVINEIMANPASSTEAPGEWFEVYNAGLLPVNMQGFKIGDSAASGDRPLHTIPALLVIPPAGYLTFGNTTNTTSNGGVPIDYAYGAALSLANSLDAIRIVSPAGFIADTPNPSCAGAAAVCEQTNFVEIERVAYASTAVSAKEGIARELKNPALDNTLVDGSNWADASVTSVYGPRGRGTPKAQNSTFVP